MIQIADATDVSQLFCFCVSASDHWHYTNRSVDHCSCVSDTFAFLLSLSSVFFWFVDAHLRGVFFFFFVLFI